MYWFEEWGGILIWKAQHERNSCLISTTPQTHIYLLIFVLMYLYAFVRVARTLVLLYDLFFVRRSSFHELVASNGLFEYTI